MRRPPRLQRRRHRLYCRVSVPAELRPLVGRTEIVRTLGTGDYREAIRKLPLVSAEVDAELAEARRRLAHSAPPDDFALRQAALLWFGRAARESERRRAVADPEHALPARMAAAENRTVLAHLADGDDPGTLASVQRVVNSIISGGGIAVLPGSAEWRRLCDLVRRGMVEQVRRGVDEIGGSFGTSYDPLFDGAGPEAAHAEPQRPGVTVGEIVDRYLADPARAGVTAKTRRDLGFTRRLLTELLGEDADVRSVAREDCRRVRDVLTALPPNSSKRWPKRKLARIAEEARRRGTPPMSPRTANAYLHKLSALFRWAVREEYLDRNPAEGLRVAEPEVHARDARRPFSLDQLRKMFAAPIYTGCRDDGAGYDVPGPNVFRKWRFWLLPIGLFSGMRLNEICSLRTDDVAERDGALCFLVRPDDDGGKRLKTAAARRVVPVHPELVMMGLLRYVEEQRGAGQVRLFPEIKADTRGYYSDHGQKWFSRFVDKAGAREPRTSFHSTRHNFRDALREADAPRDVTLALGGWSSGHVADNYGGGLRPSTLARWIEKVRYDGLDLSHLHVE